MDGSTASACAKWGGIALGAALAVLVLFAARVPAAGSSDGAALTVAAEVPGELSASPGGTLIEARSLRAGGRAAKGSVRLRNLTGRRLEVRARLVADASDLGGAPRVALGDLGSAAPGASLPGLLLLERGEQRTLAATAGLRRAAAGRTDGRFAQLRIVFSARPVGAAG